MANVRDRIQVAACTAFSKVSRSPAQAGFRDWALNSVVAAKPPAVPSSINNYRRIFRPQPRDDRVLAVALCAAVEGVRALRLAVPDLGLLHAERRELYRGESSPLSLPNTPCLAFIQPCWPSYFPYALASFQLTTLC